MRSEVEAHESETPTPVDAKRSRSLRDLTFLRPALQQIQRLFTLAGFTLTYARVSGIRDAELYRPFLQPWNAPEWRRLLRNGDSHSLVPLEAKYILYTVLLDALVNCEGAVAECGVYKGGTAIIMADLAAKFGRSLHLFDTFAGMPKTRNEKDLHKEGDFDDTTLPAVKAYLGERSNVTFHPGLIPGTLATVADKTFAFVHIDLDIYDSVLAAVTFFYPRLASGGQIVFDDYGYPSCPGARAAVDDFFRGRNDALLTLSTGQCVVRKPVKA